MDENRSSSDSFFEILDFVATGDQDRDFGVPQRSDVRGVTKVKLNRW